MEIATTTPKMTFLLMAVRQKLRTAFPDGLVDPANRQEIALQLQDRQCEIRDRLYPIQGESHDNADALAEAKAAYDASVKAREVVFGRTAACYEVDQDLWSDFSDLYKCRNGFRPRFPISRADVLRWFEEDRKAHPPGSDAPPVEPRELGAHELQIQDELAALGFKMEYKPDARPTEYFIPPFSMGWVVVSTNDPDLKPENVPSEVRGLACYF